MIRKKLNQKGGFTLVEMVATIICSALVLFGASAVVLSTLRAQQYTGNSVGNQQMIRIIHRGLSQLSGSIQYYEVTDGGTEWTLYYDSSGTELMDFSGGELSVGGNVIARGIDAATLDVDDLEEKLVTIRFTLDGHEFELVTYCRMLNGDLSDAPPDSGGADAGAGLAADVPNAEPSARSALLATLAGEYGSTGQIGGSDTYYSEWYLGGTYIANPDWGPETPWCACFLSWGMAQLPDGTLGETPRFATVDRGVEWFRDRDLWLEPDGDPRPGDLIFFDWDGDGSAEHVGAVLTVADGTVTTIEGNSGGTVRSDTYLRSLSGILGYGALPWTE